MKCIGIVIKMEEFELMKADLLLSGGDNPFLQLDSATCAEENDSHLARGSALRQRRGSKVNISNDVLLLLLID